MNDRLGSLLRIAAGVAAVVLVALTTFVPLHTNDFWLQAKVGQIIVEQGQVPRTLLFPFTWAADYRFNLHEALPSVVFYLLEHHLGYDLLLFVKGALGLLMFVLLLREAGRSSGRPDVGLALAVLGLAAMNYRFVMRPELFALFTLLGVLALCERVRDGAPARLLAWALPLQLLWANSHGSFILGPGVAGLYAAGEAFDAARRGGLGAGWRAGRPYAALALAMLPVSVLNPLGLDLLLFPFQLSNSQATLTFIPEWKPTFSPFFRQEPGFWLIAAAALTGIGVALARWRVLRATDLLLLATFLTLAVLRVRHGVWLGIVVPLVAARLLRRPAVARPAPEPLVLVVVTACSVACIALALKYGNAYSARPYYTPSKNFTVPMRDVLMSPEVQGNVFVSFELGSELVYRTWPRLKPSIDTRIDSYGDAYFLMHHEMFAVEERLLPFLEDFDVHWMLLLRRDFETIGQFKGLLERGWRMHFADQKMVLLHRP